MTTLPFDELPTVNGIKEEEGYHQQIVADLHWRTLRLFHYFRLLIPISFYFAFQEVAFEKNTTYVLDQTFWLILPVEQVFIISAYLIFSILLLSVSFLFRHFFYWQLSIAVVIDIAAICFSIFLTGGLTIGSGFILVSLLAVAGLIAPGLYPMLYAAIASIVLLYTLLIIRLQPQGLHNIEFVYGGFLSIGFFLLAWVAVNLGRYVQTQSFLAVIRQKALIDQMELNQIIIDNIPEGVVVLDQQDRLIMLNPKAKRLLALKDVNHAHIDDSVANFTVTLERAKHSDDLVLLLHNNHELLINEVAAYAHQLKKNTRLILVYDYELEAKRLHQNKLAALGRLAANIAHEIRNPLTAIGYANDLIEEKSPECHRFNQIVREHVNRINRIITEILSLSRPGKHNGKLFELSHWLQKWLEEEKATGLISSEIELRYDLTPCTVFCDQEVLTRLLTNLVENSKQHAGSVTPLILTFTLKAKVQQVELILEDNGVGIEDVVRSQIFEPFFTTGSQSTGLGLYIAQELAQSNKITLSSLEYAHGARFVLALPTSHD